MNTNNPYAGPTYNTTSSDRASRAARKEAMRQQLVQSPQLLKQIQTVLQSPDDVSILTELLGEMNMGNRGGKSRASRKRASRKRSSRRKY
jgi:hypothetical protein